MIRHLRTASTPQRLIAASLSLLITSCGATRYSASGPVDAYELSRSVLVIKDVQGAEATHSWEPISNFDLSLYPSRAINSGVKGSSIRVAWTRNCEDERDACVDTCLKSLSGSAWSHASKGSKFKICDEKCRPAYLDCCELREQKEVLKFPLVDDAVDWLKRHRKEVLVGTIVVIAGITFVVIVVGTGGTALLLAPAVLLVSSDASSELPIAAVKP